MWSAVTYTRINCIELRLARGAGTEVFPPGSEVGRATSALPDQYGIEAACQLLKYLVFSFV
jgi:hypothetical protein